MKVTILICSMIFWFPLASYCNDQKSASVNYCHDKESWEQYHDLLSKYPEDDEIYALYALRVGLCTMVEAETISTNRAIDIFERMRETLVQYYRENEEQKKGV